MWAQGEEISCIYASPFLRTMQTAHQVAEVLNLPVIVENGICEGLLPSMPSSSMSCLGLQPEHQTAAPLPAAKPSRQAAMLGVICNRYMEGSLYLRKAHTGAPVLRL